MSEIHMHHFTPVNSTAFHFDEDDNLFVSKSGDWELYYRQLEKGSRQYVMGIEFEGTLRSCIGPFDLPSPIILHTLMERVLETVGREMQCIMLGVFDAKERDNYLRDLFTIVQQAANNGNFAEVNEILRRIKPESEEVDPAPDGIYWNASHFIRRWSPVHHQPIQFNNHEMYFLGVLKYDTQQAEFISMAQSGTQKLQLHLLTGWTEHYDELLHDNLTAFKANVDKLGFEFFP